MLISSIGYCFSLLKCTAKTTVSLKSNLQSSHDINCPGYYSLLKCVAKTTSFKVATVGCIPVCKSLLLVNMGQMPLGIRFRRNMFTYFHRPDLELKAKQDGSTCPWESRSDGNDWAQLWKIHVILMAKRLISNKHISSAICVDRFFWSLLSTIGGYSWMLESPTHSVTSPISISATVTLNLSAWVSCPL